MKVKIEVDIFGDPEHCWESYLRGDDICHYARHGHCMLFRSSEDDYFDPLADFPKITVIEKGDRMRKHDRCKALFEKSDEEKRMERWDKPGA